MRLNLLLLFGIIGISSWAQPNDQELISRLGKIQAVVPLQFDVDVRSRIYDYQKSSNSANVETLRRFLTFDKGLKAIFIERNVPEELRYASISLTNFNYTENGKDGKEGPFALRYRIATRNNLTITNYIDERRDVLKAAVAFCEEIKLLYERHGDWRLALTAYNSNEDEWLKAWTLAGDNRDFETVSSFLPYSVKGTYAQFVAASYWAHYYKEMGYKINPLALSTETVSVLKYTTLYQLASKLNMDYKLLKELNPTYKKNVIPHTDEAFYLVIPTTRVNLFYELGDDVYVYASTPVYTHTEVKVIENVVHDTIINTIAEEQVPITTQTPAAKSNLATIYYTVRKGDMLFKIADLYDCDISQIQLWNDINGEFIDINQKLKIVVPISELSYYKKIDKLTDKELTFILKKD
jgi:membrane-bound lytic murein transglycosylase D